MPGDFVARVTTKPSKEERRTCSNCGRLGHIVTNCTNPEAHHFKVGIEIEGWWFDLIGKQELARDICGTEGREDGSLMRVSRCTGGDEGRDLDLEDDVEDCEEGCDDCPHPIERTNPVRCSQGKKDCKACGARCWEFQTKPGSLGEALRQLSQLYPDVTSRAAGMHVHMSFKEKTSIALLASDKFFKYWHKKWTEWGKKNNVKGAFWERLDNENQYCRPNSMHEFGANPAKALVTAHRDRYRQINFTAFDGHGTVEFRMLPMFQKGNLAVLAIEALVDMVETYLQEAELHADIAVKTKVAEGPDKPLQLPAVVNDIDLPPLERPKVFGEVELSGKVQMGVVNDDKGQPTGVVRVFAYQVDTYLANASQDAVKKKQQIADPKTHKVKWENFNPMPTARTER